MNMPGDYSLLIGFTKRTSYSMAKALLRKGLKLIISDTVSDPEKKSLISELKNIGPVIDFLGRQSADILDDYQISLILPSPGVPLSIPLIKEARKRQIKVIGDIELFYEYLPLNRYIGITGTDGKTTTTTLVYKMIGKEQNAFLGGNIGIPVFDHFDKAEKDSIFVLELSSFQLETIKTFRPFIAACLNIAEDHLDRYRTIRSYAEAKKNIFLNQFAEDLSILNLDSHYFSFLKKGLKSRSLTFSFNNEKADIFMKDSVIYLKNKPFIERKDIRLKGDHNIENVMAAILISKSCGVSDEAIRATLDSFSGLEHRLEFVRTVKGVDYYNDSKSTTVNALEKALLSFESPIVLIAGGRDKGLSFKKIRRLAHKKLKKLVLIGEASGKIKKELSFPDSYNAEDLSSAVRYAREHTSKGDVVILSPGCASYDMFKNFEERGKKFKEQVFLLDA